MAAQGSLEWWRNYLAGLNRGSRTYYADAAYAQNILGIMQRDGLSNSSQLPVGNPTQDSGGPSSSTWNVFRDGTIAAAAFFGLGAAAGGGSATAAGEGAAGAATSEAVAVDFSYLDAIEAGDAWAGGEEFVSAAAVESAAPSFWDKALDAGTELAKKYAAAEIASRFAPNRDLSSRIQPAGGVPLVRYSGQPGDALGTLLSPAALKTLLTLGVVGLVGALAWRVAKK